MNTRPFVIERASEADVPRIHALQRMAFRHETEFSQDFVFTAIFAQTPQEVRDDCACKIVLKAAQAGEVVGSVRAHGEATRCLVSWLVVHPGFRRRGIGTALMTEIEGRFPEAEWFQLIALARGTHRSTFFEQLGYGRRSELRVCGTLHVSHLTKQAPQHTLARGVGRGFSPLSDSLGTNKAG